MCAALQLVHVRETIQSERSEIQPVGKLDPGREEVNASTGLKQPMYQITCATSGQAFLVDTGAAVSLLPRSLGGPVPSSDSESPVLQTANGGILQTYGTIQRRMNFDGKLHIHTFVIADVIEPMLGWDFLSNHLAVIVAKGPHSYFQCVCEPAAPTAKPARAAFVPYRRPSNQNSAQV